MVLWEPEIVNSFINHDFIPMPAEALSRFERQVEKLHTFYGRVALQSPRVQQTELLKALLGGMGDRKVGIYSELHEVQAYYLGYNHPEVVTLAYLSVQLPLCDLCWLTRSIQILHLLGLVQERAPAHPGEVRRRLEGVQQAKAAVHAAARSC
jgi:hypothetical protein